MLWQCHCTAGDHEVSIPNDQVRITKKPRPALCPPVRGDCREWMRFWKSRSLRIWHTNLTCTCTIGSSHSENRHRQQAHSTRPAAIRLKGLGDVHAGQGATEAIAVCTLCQAAAYVLFKTSPNACGSHNQGTCACLEYMHNHACACLHETFARNEYWLPLGMRNLKISTYVRCVHEVATDAASSSSAGCGCQCSMHTLQHTYTLHALMHTHSPTYHMHTGCGIWARMNFSTHTRT